MLGCQERDSNPRLHSETRILATIQMVKEFHLESGALDRSAILTAYKVSNVRCLKILYQNLFKHFIKLNLISDYCYH